MGESIVRIEHLSHRYSSAWAIKDINFTIEQRGILGLLGSNGAGKSTTMNILCGVLNQTEGNVFIEGINLREHPEEAKKLLGFLPQTAPLYLDLTVDEYLSYCARIRSVEKSKFKSALSNAKEQCGIGHFSKRLIRNLSGGYRQRVGIAQAIIHKPKLVVLDEPTNGLDPNQITEVRKLIKEIAEERSVVFSTHILSEVQAICKDIKMIEQGHMVFADTVDAFNNYIAPNSVVINMESPPLKVELEAIPGIINVEELMNEKTFRLKFNTTPAITEQIIEISMNKGWHLREITLEKGSLEEIFAQLSNKTKKK
jgi:ABC-2 type transport system ATP-binding protein